MGPRQRIKTIAAELSRESGETVTAAARRVVRERDHGVAMLADIANLCSATEDESPYEAVERLMDDYRNVVRQRDQLVSENGTIRRKTERLFEKWAHFNTRVEVSRIGRVTMSAANICGSLMRAFRRARRS